MSSSVQSHASIAYMLVMSVSFQIIVVSLNSFVRLDYLLIK